RPIRPSFAARYNNDHSTITILILCRDMAPPRNERRRQALGDAAIAILGTPGIHSLSHRAVDERAELPAGTAANYFPTRDELLAAAARRVFGLHIEAMDSPDSQVAGPGPTLRPTTAPVPWPSTS